MKKCCYMLVMAIALIGCQTTELSPTEKSIDVSVTVSPGKYLHDAIVGAATHRRWTPNDISDNTIRLTLVQRSHLVVVDAIIIDENHYCLQCVSSNISAAKYMQWISNLQREIAKYAR